MRLFTGPILAWNPDGKATISPNNAAYSQARQRLEPTPFFGCLDFLQRRFHREDLFHGYLSGC